MLCTGGVTRSIPSRLPPPHPLTPAPAATPAPPRPKGATACRGGCSEAVLSLAQPAVPIPRNESAPKGQRKPTPPPTLTLNPPPASI